MSLDQPARPAAFRGDVRSYRARSAVKAAWWTANRALGRVVAGTDDDGETTFSSPPPPPGLLRQAWLDAFRKEAEDVAAGLYPVAERIAPPLQALERAVDVMTDARQVKARRLARGGVEVRDQAPSTAYPNYYRQNFHFQSGGWFTAESARRYEAQVEALFSGAAGPMRRRALALLARAWRGRDHRGVRVVDVACGSGAFLRDLKVAFPRAEVAGVDLSAPYLAEARGRSGAKVVQASAERLPFANDSLEAVTCVYLFHELPPRVRPVVVAEMARVLKPGGHLAFADSIQKVDDPRLGLPLQAFPAFFHEPFYASYQDTDLQALFGAAGLSLVEQDIAFLTKAMLFRKS